MGAYCKSQKGDLLTVHLSSSNENWVILAQDPESGLILVRKCTFGPENAILVLEV